MSWLWFQVTILYLINVNRRLYLYVICLKVASSIISKRRQTEPKFPCCEFLYMMELFNQLGSFRCFFLTWGNMQALTQRWTHTSAPYHWFVYRVRCQWWTQCGPGFVWESAVCSWRGGKGVAGRGNRLQGETHKSEWRSEHSTTSAPPQSRGQSSSTSCPGRASPPAQASRD